VYFNSPPSRHENKSVSKFIPPARVNYVILTRLLMQTMKKALIIGGFILFGFSLQAQTNAAVVPTPENASSPQGSNDPLQLKEKIHNFGRIPQGRPATYTFEILNTGTESLKLNNVQASCGCTTPEWSKEPIEPGGSSSIKVGYNAYAEGSFTKTVTIFYGGTKTKTLTITGEVYKSPPTSAPQNPSVQFLKQTN
jgi:hypothetical protein